MQWKIQIQILQQDLMFLANRVDITIGNQLCHCHLSLMLGALLCSIALYLIVLCLNPIQSVISQVCRVLQEASSLACECRRKTIICQIFVGTRTKTMADIHKIYHLLDTCTTNMNWLLSIYIPDFNTVFNEILLSLPQILTNDSSIPPCISMVTEDTIWELTRILSSDNLGIVLDIRTINGMERLLSCLAKLVEADNSELQHKCLKMIVEITAAAESNLDLRCKLFKTNSRGSKAIIQQLSRVMKETGDSTLQVLAIRSIGSLAKTFKRENYNIINVLVLKLDNEQQEVVIEGLGALIKFVCEDNFLCKEHSERMIELNAIKPLVKLLKADDDQQQRRKLLLHGLVLICHLAVNAEYNKAMEEAKVLTVIQQLLTTKRGLCKVVSQHAGLKLLADKAILYLTLYYKY